MIMGEMACTGRSEIGKSQLTFTDPVGWLFRTRPGTVLVTLAGDGQATFGEFEIHSRLPVRVLMGVNLDLGCG